ncbi:hypothetical protein LEMLEM_LOCUS4718 [Lemmus lemmus]
MTPKGSGTIRRAFRLFGYQAGQKRQQEGPQATPDGLFSLWNHRKTKQLFYRLP